MDNEKSPEWNVAFAIYKKAKEIGLEELSANDITSRRELESTISESLKKFQAYNKREILKILDEEKASFEQAIEESKQETQASLQ